MKLFITAFFHPNVLKTIHIWNW